MSKDELIKRIEGNHIYHPPTSEDQIERYHQVRVATAECAKRLVELAPISRELSLALTAMEEAMFWANAAISRDGEG